MSCDTGAVIDETIGISSGVYRVLVYPVKPIPQTQLVKILREGVLFWVGTIAASLLPTGDTPYDVAVQLLNATLQIVKAP
jgi:hypothetical protein